MASLQLNSVVSFLLAASLLSHSLSTEATTVNYCDKTQNYPVKVDAVDIFPNPIVAGKEATFNISASSDQPISGGKIDLQVSLFRITVHSEAHDICEKTPCPISGKFVLSHSQTLPGITPSGSYTLKMTMEDEKKQKLTCISFDFKIKGGWWVSSI